MVYFFQRRAFVHRNVVSLIAFDFVLWIVDSGVVYISLVINVFCVHLNDLAGDVACLRVPGHVIADFEMVCHIGLPEF